MSLATQDPYIKRIELGAPLGPAVLDANGLASAVSPLTLGNFTTGGSIGTAPTTVDIATVIVVTQSTASQTITVPTPTAGLGKKVTIINNGSQAVTVFGTSVAAGAAIDGIYNGSAWTHIL